MCVSSHTVYIQSMADAEERDLHLLFINIQEYLHEDVLCLRMEFSFLFFFHSAFISFLISVMAAWLIFMSMGFI